MRGEDCEKSASYSLNTGNEERQVFKKEKREKGDNMETNNILIVEDDKEIREGVQIYLQSQGYKVFQAADGIEGLEIIDKEDIHLAIVDIMMPRMDGIRMTMKLREKHDFPVIMLSAKSEEVDKITGLNIGADDYVTKPFTPMELMARVNSQLRRYRKFLEKLTPQENVHVIGGLEINEDAVEVTMDGKPVKLTPIEYKILLLLAKNPGRVFSSEEIYERSKESEIFKGGVGSWIQNRKTAVRQELL